MSSVTLSVPDDSLVALNLTPEQAGPELRLLAAIKLYELGRLSSGAAAHLAGLPRVVFMGRLAEFGVATFALTADELKAELAGA